MSDQKVSECPSCHGTLWATIVIDGHACANGLCMCQPNGKVWASSEPVPSLTPKSDVNNDTHQLPWKTALLPWIYMALAVVGLVTGVTYAIVIGVLGSIVWSVANSQAKINLLLAEKLDAIHRDLNERR